MAVRIRLWTSLWTLLLPHSFISGVVSTTFKMENKCSYKVWPGILSNAGTAPLPTTGFTLKPGESRTIDAPSSWSGRLWGRTHCTEDSATGAFSCLTGDCNSGKIECDGNNAEPPATLAEFTLDGAGGMDFFDVSLVDGYNLPMLVAPQGGAGGDNCTTTGCVVDLNGGACPSALKVTSADGIQGIACKSACEAFQEPQYCCSGPYGTPDVCKPSSYSQIFKRACPSAYSYAYDDKTSTFTCASADYRVTFCPSPNTSQKSSSSSSSGEEGQNVGGGSPPVVVNGTMVYEGAMMETSGASLSSTCSHVHFISGAAATVTSLLRLRQLL